VQSRLRFAREIAIEHFRIQLDAAFPGHRVFDRVDFNAVNAALTRKLSLSRSQRKHDPIGWML